MLSVIIPSRVEAYLQKTIDELLSKAEGEIEIIVVLDGYWPVVPVKADPRVTVVHHGMQHDSFGMRTGINTGMSLAKGTHVMKIDEHCVVDQGFDVKLRADCEGNWMVIPRRYRLDATNWSIVEDGRPPVDYNYVTYPYLRINDPACGLHGAEWKRPERAEILIDDTVTCQGSCYFTTKKWWFEKIAPMDTVLYGQFINEAQEISFKTWLGGGRVVVNKKTWYAHLHKGKEGKGYGFSNAQYRTHQAERNRGRKACIDFWVNNKWDKRERDWEWLVNYFNPMPTWGEQWKKDLERDVELELAATQK